MKLPAGFGEVDFTDWFRGLISAFIQGGASAVVSGIVVSLKDPQHYSFGTWNFFEIVGSVFLMSGTLGMFAFLRTAPIPPLKTVTTTTTTLSGPPRAWNQPAPPPIATVTTTEETHQEPIKGTS